MIGIERGVIAEDLRDKIGHDKKSCKKPMKASSGNIIDKVFFHGEPPVEKSCTQTIGHPRTFCYWSNAAGAFGEDIIPVLGRCQMYFLSSESKILSNRGNQIPYDVGGLMKLILGLALVLVVSGAAQAAKNCTDMPKEKWMSEADFKKMVEGQGYKISKFKQPGTCYEIYGTDKDGKKVEIYFNPVDGKVFQSK